MKNYIITNGRLESCRVEAVCQENRTKFISRRLTAESDIYEINCNPLKMIKIIHALGTRPRFSMVFGFKGN